MSRRSNKGRFRVWDKSSDSFNHQDLVYNWDELDLLIGGIGTSSGDFSTGVPGVSTWLGPGDNGTPKRDLYTVIKGLNKNDVPLGTVVLWWKPSADVQLPDGWVACDGSEYTEGSHDYPGGGSVRVPDLRNAIPLGATNAEGTSALSRDVLEGSWGVTNKGKPGDANNTPEGAPGIGYHSKWDNHAGNSVRDLAHNHGATGLYMPAHKHKMTHYHSLPDHKHGIPSHTHGMRHFHWTQTHEHSVVAGTRITNPHEDSAPDSTFSWLKSGTGTDIRVSRVPHYHGSYGFNTNGGIIAGANRWLGQQQSFPQFNGQQVPPQATSLAMIDGVVDMTLGFPAATERSHTDATGLMTDFINTGGGRQSGVPIDSQANVISFTDDAAAAPITGSTGTTNTSVDVRMNYVGLLYIIKIKVAHNLLALGTDQDYPGWDN